MEVLRRFKWIMRISLSKRLLGLIGCVCILLTILGLNTNTQRPQQHFTFSLRAAENPTADGFAINESPLQHVLYLKTHKTGSTTMFSILAEYSRSHDLLPLLPTKYHITQTRQFTEADLKLIPGIEKYDMVFSHMIYSPRILGYLHDDTFQVTTLREPFSNFVSAFLYYKNEWNAPYLAKIKTKDPLTEYLRNPLKYDKDPNWSFTINRQSVDLGYDVEKGFNDGKYIEQFIQETNSRFNLVVIMEHYDEGLVMMKRALHWKTEDILYLRQNNGNFYHKIERERNIPLETQQKELHAKFSQADIMLYNYFLNKFNEKMAEEVGLQEEVAEYRNILETFQQFCDKTTGSNENLVIPTGKWSNAFQVSTFKCKWLSKDDTAMTAHLLSKERMYYDKKYLMSKAMKKHVAKINKKILGNTNTEERNVKEKNRKNTAANSAEDKFEISNK